MIATTGVVWLNWAAITAEGIGTAEGAGDAVDAGEVVTETDGESESDGVSDTEGDGVTEIDGEVEGDGVSETDGEGNGGEMLKMSTMEEELELVPPAKRPRLPTEVAAKSSRAWESEAVVQLLDDAL